ncbi:PIN domain-containing protein [Gilvimarinus xylanilyticus]|jgi:predicted nucleic-acid-binding protein|uniref:Type II toxin-antitoxin system VapC family toxin n=1 Tax=Gilvimarinus xylanilyticus TaxID=2944139 RepID=A0A9X2I2T8_9GAMM|nr:type II toxin-antitoxin system VapC family toxin [Gilvimarinus xylanilyticus]MCP8898477.1 type II toxin-antitoxin system VapC family toxin [Gilvimarinus xylanilyticus]
MIAIDTNVLLRYLLQDEQGQSRKAASLITGVMPVLVMDVVLVETIWVLAGKRYRLEREAIAGVINALFEEPNIVFEDGQTVWRALNDYKKAQPVRVGGKKKSADFPDALIVNKAKHQAQQWRQALKGVYTFDVAAREIPGTLSP